MGIISTVLLSGVSHVGLRMDVACESKQRMTSRISEALYSGIPVQTDDGASEKKVKRVGPPYYLSRVVNDTLMHYS